MKKIFTLLAAAAVTVPMMTAAEKTVTAELGYKFDSYGTTYSKVAELANQKITYDETEKAYTLVNFLGWEGANLTFKLSETTFTVTENEIPVVKYPMIIAFEGGDATVSTDSYKFLPDNEKIVSKKHRRFHVNTTENSAVFTGVLDEKGETNDYRLSGDTYFGCLTELSLRNATTTLASNCLSYAVIDENNNIKLIIGGGNAKGDVWGMTVQKVPAGGDWNSYTKTYATSTAVMYTFPAELKGGDPEPVEPEGNLTIDLWKVAAAAFPTAYTEKIGSMTGNISYDEATKHYTIKDFLGIKKANLTFYIDENGTPESPVDLGYGTTNPMKNNVEGFENEDDYMVRIVMPDASEQQGDLADWTNIIIPVVNSWNEKDHKTFTFKFSEESFNQKDIKPEFATGIFKGEENDYMLLNPSFGGHWGDAAQIRQSSMKKCHAAKIDNKWTVRIYCNGTSVNQKASADAEWEWNRETYRLSSPLIMFTIPTDLGAGVEGIEIENGIDENAPVEYYNLQGIKVENPAAGLYIKRQGNKVEKVIIR